MKAILCSLFVASLASTALADSAAPAIDVARADVAAARSRWDAAVAEGHPVQAGKLARLHLEAMQRRNAALRTTEEPVAVNQPARTHATTTTTTARR